MVFRVIFVDNSQTFSNSFCCVLVVTSDHDWTDSRFFSHSNSFCSFSTLRVNHPNQTSKDQVVFKLFRSKIFWNTIDNLIRTRKDTQGLVSHFRVVCVNYVIDLIINRSDISSFIPSNTTFQELVRGSLDCYEEFTIWQWMNR